MSDGGQSAATWTKRPKSAQREWIAPLRIRHQGMADWLMHSDFPMEHIDELPAEGHCAGMNSAASTRDVAGWEEDSHDIPASMDAFLAQVERRAFRIAELRLGHREDALDAVRDTMLRLVKYHRAEPAHEWSPLFWGILHRLIVGIRRRRKVHAIMTCWLGRRSDTGDQLPVWDSPDTSPKSQSCLQAQQSYADMAVAVKLLPQRQHEIFVLHVLEGLSIAEAAKAIGCSEGSVEVHLSRALAKLRAQPASWR